LVRITLAELKVLEDIVYRWKDLEVTSEAYQNAVA